MKPELKNLILLIQGGKECWATSKEKEPNEIYSRIENEELCDDKLFITDGFKESLAIPLIKETTKVTTLMMQKISMSHRTFLIDPVTKTWKELLKKWEEKELEEKMVIQIYTLSGRERAIVEITSMYETAYPGKPIRVSLRLILWCQF